MNPKNENSDPLNQPPLSEKDFIQNGNFFKSLPFWLWPFLLTVAVSLVWGTTGWYEAFLSKEKEHEPFLEVTNREFSLFLWQFPLFLRNHSAKKVGYLPGFLSSQENFHPGTEEEFVSAPPDLIFLYHVWHRLLAPKFIERPISATEFEEFLKQLPEWEPKNWKEAPKDYLNLVESKKYLQVENLQTLSESELPLMVKQAFQGWKNYFKEGSQINDLNPTFAQIRGFLEKYPHYARNYWRNIEMIHHEKIAGSLYLKDTINENSKLDSVVPRDQLSPFLKVGLFNAQESEQHR